MAIEDALGEVSQNLECVPFGILNNIMDAAPLICDVDRGRLEVIADAASAQAIALTKEEVRLAMDYLPDFSCAYASDGAGNTVKIPATAYQKKSSFRERFPKLAKVFGVAFAALLGVTAVSGCISEEYKEITKKTYDSGRDGVNGTIDDKIKFESGDTVFRIDQSTGENTTYLYEKMEVGGALNVKYDDAASNSKPYDVIKVNSIKSKAKYRKDTALGNSDVFSGEIRGLFLDAGKEGEAHTADDEIIFELAGKSEGGEEGTKQFVVSNFTISNLTGLSERLGNGGYAKVRYEKGTQPTYNTISVDEIKSKATYQKEVAAKKAEDEKFWNDAKSNAIIGGLGIGILISLGVTIAAARDTINDYMRRRWRNN